MKMATLALALAITVATSSSTLADDKRISTDLSGYNEVHFIFSAGPPASAALRGAVSTNASGRFKARIDEDAQTIHYELNYANLQGNVTQAHIHFGQQHTVGGIVVWLCETDAAQHPVVALRRPVTPQCPPSGTVTGVIGPEKVIDVPGQGIAPGEFAELLRAIRAGATYANVHSSVFAPGEIRGQIDHGHSDRD
jgi:CHRD domain-containing protein